MVTGLRDLVSTKGNPNLRGVPVALVVTCHILNDPTTGIGAVVGTPNKGGHHPLAIIYHSSLTHCPERLFCWCFGHLETVWA